MILAGDVGGTRVALALVEREAGARPELAAFGVAAPVVVDPSAPLLGAARWATLAGQA